jgi:DNA-binding Xre family transcriptional regulator
MMKKDLCNVADISTSSVTKLAKNQNVNTEILDKICHALNCNIEDIMEYVHEDNKTKGVKNE